MKKDTIRYSNGLEIDQFWSPSVKLRWVEKEVSINEFTSKTEKVLQQLHTSNLGNQKWLDVPLDTV